MLTGRSAYTQVTRGLPRAGRPGDIQEPRRRGGWCHGPAVWVAAGPGGGWPAMVTAASAAVRSWRRTVSSLAGVRGVLEQAAQVLGPGMAGADFTGGEGERLPVVRFIYRVIGASVDRE